MRTLCFQCYRAELDRVSALKGANQSSTSARERSLAGRSSSTGGSSASHGENADARWQWLLPFEPVNKPRLVMLRAERAVVRSATQNGVGKYADRRHQAQIAARCALQQIAVALDARAANAASATLETERRQERERAMAAAIHAAELQLPEAWLPFVVAR